MGVVALDSTRPGCLFLFVTAGGRFVCRGSPTVESTVYVASRARAMELCLVSPNYPNVMSTRRMASCVILTTLINTAMIINMATIDYAEA
jgi:hypothetical protein